MMPLTTVPTLRPRSAGADITAANGTSCCGTHATAPSAKEAAIRLPMPCPSAAARAKQKASTIWTSTSLRRS
jgi:hypothetical protein